jgi:hypothetical protein
MRGRRSLHPVGVGYRGWLEVFGDRRRWRNVPLLERTSTRAALVRCSRAAGLPEPLPDVLGIAVKLLDTYGPGADQDLLFSSVPDRPTLRGVLVPARSFLRGAFSTLLPYRVGRKRRGLVAAPGQDTARGRPRARFRRAEPCHGPARRVRAVGGRRPSPPATDRPTLADGTSASGPRGAAAFQPMGHGTGSPAHGLDQPAAPSHLRRQSAGVEAAQLSTEHTRAACLTASPPWDRSDVGLAACQGSGVL